MREDATSSAALALCAKPNVAAKPAAIFNASRRVWSTYVSYAHPSVSFISHGAHDRARAASSPRHRAFPSPVIHARLIADVTRRPRLSAPRTHARASPASSRPARTRAKIIPTRGHARSSRSLSRARPRARVRVASRVVPRAPFRHRPRSRPRAASRARGERGS